MINIYVGPAIGNVIAGHQAEGTSAQVLRNEHVARWKQGGLRAAVLQITNWQTLGMVMNEIRRSEGELVLCKSRTDFDNIPEGAFGIGFTVEGYEAFAGDFEALYALAELGALAFTFTHNTQNLLCTGAAERYGDGGFSHLGKATLLELKNVPMMVDLVHTSRGSFWDALDIWDGDVFVSHSNSDHVCAQGRNLTDDQIKAVAERNGVIGTNTYRGYVNSADPFNATLSDYLDHCMRTYDLVGPNHMAIGADYWEAFRLQVEQTLPAVDPDNALGLKDAGPSLYATGPAGLEDATQLGKIAAGLAERGLTDDEVALATGGAYLNMLARVRP
jgi:membrane dipeptidase